MEMQAAARRTPLQLSIFHLQELEGAAICSSTGTALNKRGTLKIPRCSRIVRGGWRGRRFSPVK
jgi:hypothetical protein